MNDRIEELKRKKNVLVARQKRAEAQERIQRTMSTMGDQSAFDTFQRMEERIDDMERQALAAAELAGELSGDTLQQEFKALEFHGNADQRLLELKQKMGMLPAGTSQAPQQLGAGRQDAGVVHDAELVEEDEDDQKA